MGENELNALQIVLDFYSIPQSRYCINGYKEEAICLNSHENDVWEVCDFEKGNKYHIMFFEGPKDACIYLLNTVVIDRALSRKMIDKFVFAL